MTLLSPSAPPPPCAGELATWLAHELRNPLAPIAAAADLLGRQPPAEQGVACQRRLKSDPPITLGWG